MKWQFEFSDRPKNAEYPVVAHQFFDNGAKKGPFYLKVEDFIDSLAASDDYESNSLKEMKSTPALPYGTIRHSVSETNNVQLITMEIPKKQWEIRYKEEKEFYTLGFPRMVVQYVVGTTIGINQLRLIETKLFSVLDDRQPINDETDLYAFPYPNVYGDGRVCWGQNERFEINELVELERMFRWFVAAPFNEELQVSTTHGIPNFKKLIELIKDQPFDDEWLMPKNKIFGDLFY